uniref:Ig-like domain-containing protein n=1 Tax=Neovison vison TaxID=452646 RepID=A0A8C7A7Z4_NEOVI
MCKAESSEKVEVCLHRDPTETLLGECVHRETFQYLHCPGGAVVECIDKLCSSFLGRWEFLRGTQLVQNLGTFLSPCLSIQVPFTTAAFLTYKVTLTVCVHPCSPEPTLVFAKDQPAHKEVQAKAGASATLSCEVAQDKTEVTWYKDGKKLSMSSNVHVKSKGCSRQLVVKQAGKADTGEYSCEAGDQKVSFHLDVTGQFFLVPPCLVWR